MKKIRGFKLALRLKEIQRRGKKAGLDASLLCEESLIPLSDAVLKALSPGVVFETLNKEEASRLSPLPGLAASIVVATLGPGFDGFREATIREAPAKTPLLDLMREVLLEEAVRFAASLIEDEATAEACELSPWGAVTDPEALAEVVRRLECGKIGVSLSPSGLAPSATTAAAISWLAKGKARKAASASGGSSARKDGPAKQ